MLEQRRIAMSGTADQIAVVLVCSLTALIATDRIVFGQAGSTGGTVGKQDKSISGGEEPHQRAKAKPRGSAIGEMPTRSISGKWAWTAKCDDASDWAGTFELMQSSDGAITGSAAGNDGSGSMSGQLVANKLIVTRSYAMHSNQIVFTLAAGGRSMQGSESSRSHGMCRYHAERS
jgi:hypothetical protein